MKQKKDEDKHGKNKYGDAMPYIVVHFTLCSTVRRPNGNSDEYE